MTRHLDRELGDDEFDALLCEVAEQRNSELDEHPSHIDLQLFRRGSINPAELNRIEEHLSLCTECVQAVFALESPSFSTKMDVRERPDVLAAPPVQARAIDDLEAFLTIAKRTIRPLLVAYGIPIDDAEDLLQASLLDLCHNPATRLLPNLKHHCQMYWRDRARASAQEVPCSDELRLERELEALLYGNRVEGLSAEEFVVLEALR